MRTALFGKLPAKRDFVAVGAPREFLSVWEEWLQAGLSASRQSLGEAWQNAFLRAPIWRFWLGQAISGATTLGAFMPSVDGIGRYFPLTILARADQGDTILPPELDPYEGWLTAAEDLLLSCLSEDTVFETVATAVAAMAGPAEPVAPVTGALRTKGGALVLKQKLDPDGLGLLRRADATRLYAGMSFWWTLGGEGYGPCLVAQNGLPDPYLFASMLTGSFDERLG